MPVTQCGCVVSSLSKTTVTWCHCGDYIRCGQAVSLKVPCSLVWLVRVLQGIAAVNMNLIYFTCCFILLFHKHFKLHSHLLVTNAYIFSHACPGIYFRYFFFSPIFNLASHFFKIPELISFTSFILCLYHSLLMPMKQPVLPKCKAETKAFLLEITSRCTLLLRNGKI